MRSIRHTQAKASSAPLHGKRGQLAWFILMGIVLIITVALLLAINRPSAEPLTPALEAAASYDKTLIKQIVASCFGSVIPPGVYLAGRQGGFIYDHNQTIATDYGTIAYQFVGRTKTGPSRAFVESQLARYAAQTLDVCVKERAGLLKRTLTTGSAACTVRVLDDMVLVEANYPVTLATAERAITVDSFGYTLPINLGRMLDAANSITQQAQATGSIQLGALAAKASPARLTVASRGNDTLIYTLIDTNTTVSGIPFIVRVATKEAP